MGGKDTQVLVYVDDLLITRADEDGITCLIDELDKQFTMKNLGEIMYFLGIKVSKSPKGTLMN